MNRFGAKLREHLKQAHNKLDIVNIDSDTFINFYRANLKSNDNKKCYLPVEIARDLINAGMNRNPSQARVIAAIRKISKSVFEHRVIDAAICIIWDSDRCYYWLSTRSNNSHPDAVKLLISAAMKQGEKLDLVFDADGVNTSGAQSLFKTIFRMPTEERRYIFTRASKQSKLYNNQRSKIDKIKKILTEMGLSI